MHISSFRVLHSNLAGKDSCDGGNKSVKGSEFDTHVVLPLDLTSMPSVAGRKNEEVMIDHL